MESLHETRTIIKTNFDWFKVFYQNKKIKKKLLISPLISLKDFIN